MGNDTVDVQEDWEKKWNETQKVGAVQGTDPTLQVCSHLFKVILPHSLSDDLYLPIVFAIPFLYCFLYALCWPLALLNMPFY